MLNTKSEITRLILVLFFEIYSLRLRRDYDSKQKQNIQTTTLIVENYALLII